MTGMTDLDEMLRLLTVRHRDGEFVYAVVPTLADAVRLDPAAVVVEDEGVTVVVPRAVAQDHGLDHTFVAAWLSLEIHSALAAVGLTAPFSRALGEAGISCNVLAGFHHDHLLVPVEQAAAAEEALRNLSRSAQRFTGTSG